MPEFEPHTMPPIERPTRGPNVSLKMDRAQFDGLAAIALCEGTSLGDQMRRAIARYIEERLSDPLFLELIELEIERRKGLLPPADETT